MPRKNSRSAKRSASRKRSGGKLRLVKLTKSPRPDKKYQAVFSNGKRVSFGARGMGDHILFSKKSKSLGQDRKKAYLSRHAKRENWRDPTSPGALSRWILWNKPSLRASVADYKRRFKM